MLTLADAFREEGHKEGFQKGEKYVLSRLISKKYHRPKEEFTSILNRLTEEKLEELGEKILMTDTWDKLLNWLENPK